jgi:hypothetical protein
MVFTGIRQGASSFAPDMTNLCILDDFDRSNNLGTLPETEPAFWNEAPSRQQFCKNPPALAVARHLSWKQAGEAGGNRPIGTGCKVKMLPLRAVPCTKSGLSQIVGRLPAAGSRQAGLARNLESRVARRHQNARLHLSPGSRLSLCCSIEITLSEHI